MRVRRNRLAAYRLVSLMLALLIILVAARSLGLTQLSNLLAVDMLARVPFSSEPIAKVWLLRESSMAPLNAREWQLVTARIQGIHARAVIVLPSFATAEEPANHAVDWKKAGDNIWLPRSERFIQDQNGRPHFVAENDGDKEQGIRCQPPLALGRHQVLPEIAGIKHAGPCFQSLVSGRAAIGWLNPAARSRIIPELDVRQLLHPEFNIADMHDNFLIVVQRNSDRNDIATTRNAIGLADSNARWQAEVLDDLLQTHELSPIKTVLFVPGLLLYLLLLLSLLPLIGPRYLLAVLAMLLLVTLLISALLLHYGHIIPPTSELLSAPLLVLLFLLQQRQLQAENVLQNDLKQMHRDLENRLPMPEFFASDKPWQQLIELINYHFSLHRSIMLERVVNEHRVREVIALNCTIDDILEMRRDYERTPYSDAITHDGPMLIDRLFFKNKQQHEQEYLIPLAFSGEILGFWAFSLIKNPGSSERAMPYVEHQQIQRFADEIAELLYHRQNLRALQGRQATAWRRWTRLEAGTELYQELDSAIALQRKYLSLMDAVSNQMQSSILLFDLFGNVLHANHRVQQLAKDWLIAFDTMNILDVLTALTSIKLGQARALLQQVTLEHQEHHLRIRDDVSKISAYVRVQAIRDRGNDTYDTAHPFTPFATRAILVEIVEDERFQERINQVKDCLVTIKVLMSKHPSMPAFLPSYLGAAHVILQSESDVLQPTSIQLCMHRALAELHAEIEHKKLQLTDDSGSTPLFAYAVPTRLQQLFQEIFLLTIHDALPGSFLSMSAEVSNDKYIVIHVSNRGYGTPLQQLGKNNVTSSLAQWQAEVASWHGQFSWQEIAGTGYELHLRLHALG